ncbi:sugar phosphate isomerase/epimerase [Melghirimyces profundicolus]|uniref:Sugar phosphate isomerase/epimerase n=1 Tax=Melghirimyces profundicolus TaxID=1242148 RepID=A0A2T6C9E8_9BACL|nr:sugar phosphate isomerase/epimerase family protein [Melghirimyces profundicolus]PTX64948.1 sugar phosphate isomerase/epimerase [Melghirimyces profundicolus]
MVTLSALADEISPDLKTQLDVLESEGIRHIELRGVWNKNILDLDDEELTFVKETLIHRKFRISSIATPIGKLGIKDDFGRHRALFERAIHVAKVFDTPCIRIFSFFIPAGESPEDYREEVLERIRILVEKAGRAGVVLLHENEKEIYGDTAKRCHDLLRSCRSPHLRAVLDPANFVQCGVQPLSEAYPLLRDHIEYVHIKDALFDEGRVVPAGQGDGEVKELLKSLISNGYRGFLSLEPHLSSGGPFDGFSGPDLFRVAARELKRLLEETSTEWK